MIGSYRPLEKPVPVTIQRSDGSAKEMKKVGEISGKLSDKEFRLSVYNYGDDEGYKESTGTMLLFRDYTNGKKTYGAGRFLNVDFSKKIGEVVAGDPVTVDFNYSYNPPCAVSTGYHCPLPQDLVKADVSAGELYSKN